MKKFSFITTLIIFLAFSSGAKAVTIDFEDVNVGSTGAVWLDYYHNATWTDGTGELGVGVMDPYIFSDPYIPAIASESQIAWNVYGNDFGIEFDAPILFESAYLTSSYYAPNALSVFGTYADGSSFNFEDVITLNPVGNQQFEEFDFLTQAISSITISPISAMELYGRDYTAYDIRPWFGVDDITYTPVTPAPEPATATLGLMSLVGLLGARRRNK